MDTRRCMVCGCPGGDHIPLRYILRPWIRHYLLGRVLARGWRP